jgi:hypothetical protein
MSQHPDYVPHRRYSVVLRNLDGSTKTVRVITNRGELKAAFMAGRASGGLFRYVKALDVEVHDDGPPEEGPDGTPVLRGYGFDRDEW